jgi:hypothetical protein
MKIHDVKQKTNEWYALRAGIPTTSDFDKIITPTGKKSGQSDKYADKCLEEYIEGGPLDDGYTSHWMKRGTELEGEARKKYEFITDVDVEQVGFVTNHGAGCSPDGFLGRWGLIEIKCLKAGNVITSYRNGVPKKYIPQVQGQMWVCEREYCDLVIYHPKLKINIIRIEKDEEYIEKLSEYVAQFNEKLNGLKEEFEEWRL